MSVFKQYHMSMALEVVTAMLMFRITALDNSLIDKKLISSQWYFRSNMAICLFLLAEIDSEEAKSLSLVQIDLYSPVYGAFSKNGVLSSNFIWEILMRFHITFLCTNIPFAMSAL